MRVISETDAFKGNAIKDEMLNRKNIFLEYFCLADSFHLFSSFVDQAAEEGLLEVKSSGSDTQEIS